ncbi:ABC transporter ATP-binding protein [Candidatus Pelagibacter communis]|uniref:ABC transporter ATP-binding protein n=1 Tax=Pelagibacter ubique TaxID=198252 RepID=UPI00094CB51E|nr:ABC transporter ATP-binding protein [Candidatus Pelagibacter ubique]
MNNLIQLKNVSKNYISSKKIEVLKNINYTFKSGKIYSLTGPSGSGKSTLLNLISLIDKPSSGFIKLNDLKINDNDNDQRDMIRSRKIGIIYQDKNLLADFSTLENVYLARLSLSNNKKKAITDAKNLLKKVGLDKRLDHYPSELSGGESQRVAISRALINSPDIILADEPTGNLDVKNARDIFKLLFSLRNKNRIIIFATHNRYFADMSDCKLSLIDGKVFTVNARN